MRHYPSDSTEAMARVVALALLADGPTDLGELDALKSGGCCFRLGIDRCRFDQIIDEFCDDLEACGKRRPSGQYDLSAECIRELLNDISDPTLRKRALEMMLDIITADGVLVREETGLISQVVDCWQIGFHAPRAVAVAKPNWQAGLRCSAAHH